MALFEGRFVRVFINGVDRSDYVLEYERTSSLCEMGDSFSIDVHSDIPEVPDPYANVLIQEWWDGDLGNVLRGYVIETQQTETGRILIDGQDKSILLADYFISRQVEANGESVDYWMSWVASKVGLNVHFEATSTAIVAPGTPMGLQNASDVIGMLERQAGYFVKYDSQNDRLETFRLGSSQPTITITGTSNLVNAMERTVGTTKTRNVVKVYGRVRFDPFTGEEETIFAETRTNIPELLVDKIAVIANPIIRRQSDAMIVATKVMNIMNTVDDIQHYSLQGLYPDIEYGQNAFVNVDTHNINFFGSKRITTISSRVDQEGVYTTITLGQKCDRVSVQLPTPPVYICSTGAGVGISWDGGDIFTSSNYGLPAEAMVCSGIAVNNYDYQMLWTVSGFYRRYTNQGTWLKFMDVLPDWTDEWHSHTEMTGDQVTIIKLVASKPHWGTFYILGISYDSLYYIGRTIVWKTTDFGTTWTHKLLPGQAAYFFMGDIPGPKTFEWPSANEVPETPFHIYDKYNSALKGTIPSDLVCSPDGTPFVLLRTLCKAFVEGGG